MAIICNNMYASCSIAFIANYMHKIAQTTTSAISIIGQNSVSCGDCSD